jgi:hypothetical protein
MGQFIAVEGVGDTVRTIDATMVVADVMSLGLRVPDLRSELRARLGPPLGLLTEPEPSPMRPPPGRAAVLAQVPPAGYHISHQYQIQVRGHG